MDRRQPRFAVALSLAALAAGLTSDTAQLARGGFPETFAEVWTTVPKRAPRGAADARLLPPWTDVEPAWLDDTDRLVRPAAAEELLLQLDRPVVSIPTETAGAASISGFLEGMLQRACSPFADSANAAALRSIDGRNDGLNAGRGGRGVSIQQKVGDRNLVTLQGASGDGAGRLSVGNSWSDVDGPVRALETRVETNESSSLFTAGGTLALLQDEQSILAARLLGGYRTVHDDRSDGFHFTADLYGARPIFCGDCCPRHYVKAGAFVDDEREFGKAGPEVGLLLYSDCDHPLTVDFAYGIGYGRTWTRNDRLFGVADSDAQLRVGTLLTPGVQVGGTLQYLDWKNSLLTKSSTGGGGFFNVALPFGSLLVDVTATDAGTNAFASLVITPDSLGRGSIVRSIRGDRTADRARITLVQDGTGGNATAQGWMGSPVARSIAVRVRDVNHTTHPGGGPTPFAVTNPCTFVGVEGDGDGNGYVSAGDFAGWGIELENNTTSTHTYTVVMQNFDGTTSTSSYTLNPGDTVFPGSDITTVPTNGPYSLTYTITVDGTPYTKKVQFGATPPFDCPS